MECPYCGSTEYRSLLEGRTARCCYKRAIERGTSPDQAKSEYAVVKSKGEWYRRQPIYKVLAEYERLMRSPGQLGQWFRVGWKERAKMVPAVIGLLERCEWDAELACEFLRVRFERWFKNSTCKSIFMAVAIKESAETMAEAGRRIEDRRRDQRLHEAGVRALGARNGDYVRTLYAGVETL